MLEIAFIILAGLVTIYLSVNSVVKSERQEKELKSAQKDLLEAQKVTIDKQDLLFKLQERYAIESKEKSDEIVRLQKLLNERSESQLAALNNLKNPLPDNLEITFLASLQLSKKEFAEIEKIIKQVRINGGNTLPIITDKTNESFEKINAFKNIAFELTIRFEKDDKNWTTSIYRAPLALLGYTTSSHNNSFLLVINEEKSRIDFDGFSLSSDKIISNYKSPSLLDFKNSKVSISYKFFYPINLQVGNIPSSNYWGAKQDYILLTMQSLTLKHKNYSIEVENLKRVASHEFTGTWREK